MTDIAARLREVIEERLRVARAMLGACAGSHRWCGDECEEFQQTNDPADAILAAERDLGVLERHVPDVYPTMLDGCRHCEGITWPCDEITAMAKRYGVTE